jgi:hypothetical protein
VFKAKFMLPWSFSEEAAAEKYMPQLQHTPRVGRAPAVSGPDGDAALAGGGAIVHDIGARPGGSDACAEAVDFVVVIDLVAVFRRVQPFFRSGFLSPWPREAVFPRPLKTPGNTGLFLYNTGQRLPCLGQRLPLTVRTYCGHEGVRHGQSASHRRRRKAARQSGCCGWSMRAATRWPICGPSAKPRPWPN